MKFWLVVSWLVYPLYKMGCGTSYGIATGKYASYHKTGLVGRLPHVQRPPWPKG